MHQLFGLPIERGTTRMGERLAAAAPEKSLSTAPHPEFFDPGADPFADYFAGGRVPHTEIEKTAIVARHPKGEPVPTIAKTDRMRRIWANSQRVLF